MKSRVDDVRMARTRSAAKMKLPLSTVTTCSGCSPEWSASMARASSVTRRRIWSAVKSTVSAGDEGMGLASE